MANKPSAYATKTLELVSVDEYGMVHFGPLDAYAKAFGTDEDKADAILDDVVDELERAGVWEDHHGSEYDIEAMMEHDEMEAAESASHQRYLNDIETAWRHAKGIL